jgi:propionyl-CoA synthetase
MRRLSYQDAYRRALEDPEAFWAEQASALSWQRPWTRVLDASSAPLYRWFSGGQINTCYNALDRHVEQGHGNNLALIYDSPVSGIVARFTYTELLERVATFAGALKNLGVEHGDRVVIYMPMVPEAVVAMLACARIGAVHSVVFGGFAPPELAKRIDDARPVVVISASCGIEGQRIVPYKPLLDDALRLSQHAVRHCIVLQRPQAPAMLIPDRDIEWTDALLGAMSASCATIEATDPLYILYTSGTTGKPKGVVRDHGGHAVALAWSMGAIFNIQRGDVFWAGSDVGWVVGHSYIVYGPLLAGCTSILFEGKPVGTPDAGAFWRVVAEHRVNALFTAPTAIRAIKKEDPTGALTSNYDIGTLKTLFLAGERCDPDTVQWAKDALGVPVVDNWWQTETGWPVVANCRGLTPLPVKPGSASVPVPGYDVRVLDDAGTPVAPGTSGNLVIKLPMPPGTLATLWENDEGYRYHYLTRYQGFYLTGDAGFIDSDGYVWIMSRIDDVINVAGHRLSTGAIEEVLAGHGAVAECAVIGATDALKGQLPVGLVVLKANATISPAQLRAELIDRVRQQIGPIAAFRHVAIVTRLPKTRSGKVLRSTMRAIADAREFKVPPTIDDPRTLEEIAGALEALGYAACAQSGHV